MHDDEKRLQLLERWMPDNPHFDSTFVDSVRDFYDDRGEITPRQRDALDNIILRWRVRPRKEKKVRDRAYSEEEVVVATPPPPQTTCPLTLTALDDAVKNAPCGHLYSRHAILQHLRICDGEAQCPVAGCSSRVQSLQAVQVQARAPIKRDVEVIDLTL